MRTAQLILKRAFDIAASGMVILLFCPFWALIALFMKCTMPGPVFFGQERIGRNFVPFCILKFHTMKVDHDAEHNFRIERMLATGFLLSLVLALAPAKSANVSDYVPLHELAAARGLCLPSDNKMTPAQQDLVIDIIRRCFQ